MLTDKLRVFNDAVNIAIGKHGKNAAAIANEVIEAAFPATAAAASNEGADAMLRQGVIAKVTKMLKTENEAGQIDFCDIADDFLPIVKRLHGHSHYVPSIGEYIHVGALIAEPELLDEARRFKRQKGLETIAEADVLDELYAAVTGR
ncbi:MULTISPECIES: hypothetical protein [unclassified Blastomonas]|uniref:hypothetical protein n=1 Tax=unclassified Blastomonas TaxID=2626550 RepID=UPI00082672F2|nr:MULTISPECIES: hypothetical protein [unclassified Blastomonas]